MVRTVMTLCQNNKKLTKITDIISSLKIIENLFFQRPDSWYDTTSNG